MNDGRRTPVPRISRRRALRNSALASVVASVLILGGLWVQMSVGRDPSLGPKIAKAKANPQRSDQSSPPSEPAADSVTAPAVPTAPAAAPEVQLAPVQTSTS